MDAAVPYVVANISALFLVGYLASTRNPGFTREDVDSSFKEERERANEKVKQELAEKAQQAEKAEKAKQAQQTEKTNQAEKAKLAASRVLDHSNPREPGKNTALPEPNKGKQVTIVNTTDPNATEYQKAHALATAALLKVDASLSESEGLRVKDQSMNEQFISASSKSDALEKTKNAYVKEFTNMCDSPTSLEADVDQGCGQVKALSKNVLDGVIGLQKVYEELLKVKDELITHHKAEALVIESAVSLSEKCVAAAESAPNKKDADDLLAKAKQKSDISVKDTPKPLENVLKSIPNIIENKKEENENVVLCEGFKEYREPIFKSATRFTPSIILTLGIALDNEDISIVVNDINNIGGRRDAREYLESMETWNTLSQSWKRDSMTLGVQQLLIEVLYAIVDSCVGESDGPNVFITALQTLKTVIDGMLISMFDKSFSDSLSISVFRERRPHEILDFKTKVDAAIIAIIASPTSDAADLSFAEIVSFVKDEESLRYAFIYLIDCIQQTPANVSDYMSCLISCIEYMALDLKNRVVGAPANVQFIKIFAISSKILSTFNDAVIPFTNNNFSSYLPNNAQQKAGLSVVTRGLGDVYFRSVFWKQAFPDIESWTTEKKEIILTLFSIKMFIDQDCKTSTHNQDFFDALSKAVMSSLRISIVHNLTDPDVPSRSAIYRCILFQIVTALEKGELNVS